MSIRRNRRWRAVVGLLGLVLVAVVAFLRTQTAWDATCTVLRRRLPSLLGTNVQIARCELDPLTQTVTLKDVTIGQQQDRPLLVVEQVELTVGSINWSSIAFDRVAVQRPRVDFDLGALGSSVDDRDECAFDALQKLDIGRLEVRGGQVRVNGQLDGRAVGVEVPSVDLQWTRRRGLAEFSLGFGQGTLRAGAGEYAIAHASFEGTLDAAESQLEVSRGELHLEDATMSFTGKVDSFCDPKLALSGQVFVPVGTLARAVGSRSSRVAGHLWARVTLSGAAQSPTVGVELQGSGVRYEDFAPDAFAANLRLANDRLEVMSLTTEAGDGSVRLSGEVRLTPTFPVRARLETEQASLGKVLEKAGLPGAWVDLGASARGTFAGTLRPALNLVGDVDVKGTRFVLASRAYNAPASAGREILAFPGGRAQMRVGVYSDRVEMTDLRVESGRTLTTGDVVLFYALDRGLVVNASSSNIDLSDFGHVSGLPWTGEGSTTVNIAGPYDDVRIAGTVSLNDFEMSRYSLGVIQGKLTYHDRVLDFPSFSGQKGKTQYFGSASLHFLKEDLGFRFAAQTPKARLEDLVDVMAKVHPYYAMFRGDLTGEAGGTIALEGPLETFSGTIGLDLHDARYFGRRLGDGRVTMRFEGGERVVLEPLTLRGPLGTCTVGGSYGFEGPLDYRYRLELSMAELLGPERAQRLGASGALALEGTVGGNADLPVGEARLVADDLKIGGQSQGGVLLDARLLGKDLQLWGKLLGESRGTGRLRLKAPFPFETSLTLVAPDLRSVLEATKEIVRRSDKAAGDGAVLASLARLGGSAAGKVVVSGALAELRTVEVQARLDRLHLAHHDLALQSQGPAQIIYAGGRFELAPLTLRGADTEVRLNGHWGPQTAELALKGELDVRLAESLVPWLERSGGRLIVDAEVAGDVRRPTLVGRAELKDVRFSLREGGVAVRQLSGQLDFTESRVLVQDVFGVLNDGRLRGRGDVRLSGFSVSQVEIGADFEGVSYQAKQVPLVASGAVLLHGKPTALQLSGGVDVVRLRYDQPFFALDRILRQLAEPPGGAISVAERTREWLQFDVDIDLSGDVRVDNANAQAALGGKLKLTGSNVSPGLVGLIEAKSGSRAFFRGNEFQISKGEVQFRERSRIDGVMDLSAQSQIRDYLVTLRTFGRLTEPKVVLTSEPTLSDADLVSLLTLGVTSREQGGYSQEAGAWLAAGALISTTGIDRHAQRFLPRNALVRDLQFNMSTAYNEVSGKVEPIWSLESKILTDKLKLGMTQPVSGRGTRAQAEYWFNDRLSARAQWDNDNQDYSFGNFGLDLRLRFERE